MSILSHLRGIARAAGFVAWTLAVGGAWVVVLLIGRPFLSETRRMRGGAHTLALWSRGLCLLLNLRVNVQGAPQSELPEKVREPLLLVSNHIGYLDVIVLASISRALFVSKDDLAGWPVMGYLARSVGTLFLDRNRPRAVAEVGKAMERIFACGESVIVFPEGTTTEGKTVGAFHTALFEPALRTSVTVQGVRLAYIPLSARDPEDLGAWTGDASFVPHLYRLFCSQGLSVGVRYQEESVRAVPEIDRRVVAAKVHQWMLQSLPGAAPVRQRGSFRRTAARFSLPRSGDRIFR